MVKAFISYSHKDEALRNELESHLAMLKRSGVIETWHDRRIVAGSELDSAISEQLESAQIILLLISADFLASNYCYDVELGRAMEKHSDGSAVVIPVILRPCDWHSSPFGKLMATPTDGKPVTMFANQDEAFTNIAKDIRRAAERFGPSQPSVQISAQRPIQPPQLSHAAMPAAERSSNLRVKRTFNDHERDDFLENAYEYIARYFEGSLNELQKRNSQISTKFKRVDANSFTASIYANGERVSVCSVVSGNIGGFGGNSIRYSASSDAPRNSWNEQLTVGDDGYTLHLQGGVMQGENKRLTEEGAAELYWSMLVRPLQ
jgi:hypothetical protein